MQTPIEKTIQGYQLQDMIGEGAYGAVYRARQEAVDRQVAVKIILPEFANRPEFIRRFETEAQLVAQLEHIHIVPLYDYWRDPEGAYLVMRLMKGGSMQDLIDRGPLPLAQTAHLLNQVASALSAAHRRKIIHRDLKPANILLDEDGNAYLSDFGIAKAIGEQADLTVTGAILGTPAFITPEQVQSLPVSPQTDIYALGVVLFTMLTGQHPFPETSPGDLIARHLRDPLPPLAEFNPDLPPEIDAVIQRATAKNPTERYPDVEAFMADFHQVLGPEIAPPPTRPLTEQILEVSNPYKGLRPFLEADAEDFFGRDDLTQQLLTRLGDADEFARFLAVVGPSGSGKSSLIKAGLMPDLRQGALPGSERWFIVSMTPGSRPLDELEVSLLRVAAEAPPDLMSQLQRDGHGLLRAAQLVLPSEDDQLLLVVDQFEELFTLTADQSQARQFMDLIFQAVTEPNSPVRVIITLRADFYDRPLMEPDFSTLVQQRTVVVIPFTSAELERAICGPIERLGVSLEPGLETEIIADVANQPGSLPLLQYALTELFERRQGRLLTREAYQKIGGVLGALGRRAEEVYQALPGDGQALSQQAFLRLISLGEGVEDTRRRVLRAELTAIDTPGSTSVDQVLEDYGKARLLSFDHDPQTRAPTVEVAHEALLREWERLREWLEENRADIRLQRMLGTAAQDWLASNADPSFLLRGSRLAQFEGWAQETSLALTADEQRFLEASLEDEARRKEKQVALERRSRNFLRALVGVFAVAALVAVVLTIFAFQQRQTAQRQAGILLASQAESELEDGFSDRAILLALEALKNYPYSPQAEHALGQAVTENRVLQLYEGHTAAVTGAAWSSDGERVANSSADNSVHIWDASSGELLRQINLPEGITGNFFDWALTVQWSPDDRYLLTISGDRFLLGSQDYDLILWDASSGEQVAMLEVPNTAEPLAGDSPTWFYHYPTGAGAAFAQDGRLATLGGDNTALIWEPLLKDQRLVLQGHTEGVNSIAWSPDFTKLATASEDGTARIWDANNGEELMQLVGHTGAVNQVVWSPDGSLLTTAGDDGTVQFWDANTGENLRQIQVVSSTVSSDEDDQIVWSLAWSPGGDYLATGSGDGTIRLWDADSGENIASMKGHDNFVSYLVWSPVDERLISTGADGQVRIWNTAPDNMVLRLPYGYVWSGEWSPDGKSFVVGTAPGSDQSSVGQIAVWDIETRLPILETSVDRDTNWEWSAYYSPDGQFILARTMYEWPDTTDANRFYVLDSQTGEIVRMLETGQDTILLLPGWSPDGQLVASGDWEGRIYFWDVDSGELVNTLNCLSWGHIVRWSPDGSKIAMLCLDFAEGINQITVLDAENYQTLVTIERDMYADPLIWFNWSPDSNRIAVAGGNDESGTVINPVYVFDANTGEEVLEIVRHTKMVSQVNWSPNGERIVSGSTDDTTRIWDAQTGDELLTLRTPTNWAVNPAWSPDGNYLLTPIGDMVEQLSGVWRVWQTTEDLIEYAKECCVFRELTPEEREQFGLPPSE